MSYKRKRFLDLPDGRFFVLADSSGPYFSGHYVPRWIVKTNPEVFPLQPGSRGSFDVRGLED